MVRYDHDPASEFGHDATEEGLHIDVYRDGEQNNLEGFTTRLDARTGI